MKFVREYTYQVKVYLTRHRYILILILECIFGLALRLQPALKSELWLDEVHSYWTARETSFSDLIFQTSSYWDVIHPSQYYVVLKIWLMGGESELYLRSLSLIFYVFNYIVLHRIFKLLSISEKATILGLLLYCCHPFFVNVEFQVRMYSSTIFFDLLAIYGLFNYQKNNSKGFFYFTVVAIALALYSDYSSIWLLASLAFYCLHLFINKSPKSWSVLKIMLLSCILASFQLYILFHNYQIYHKLVPGSVPQANITFQFYLDNILKIYGVSTDNIGFPIVFFVLTISIFFVRRYRMFLYLFLIPIILSLTYSLVFHPIFLSRNLIPSVISLVILIPIFIDNLRDNYLKIYLLFIVFAISIFANNSYRMKDFSFQSGMRQLAQNIKSENATAVFLPGTYHEYLSKYYLPQEKVDKVIFLTDESQLESIYTNESATNHLYILYDFNCVMNQPCISMLEEIQKKVCVIHRCSEVRSI